MLKSGILHPELSRLLASLGHTQQLLVCDAGYPIDANMKRIDLAWKPNEPSLILVLEEILNHTVIEKVYLAEEIKIVNKLLHNQILHLLPRDVLIEYMPHENFKMRGKSAVGAVRTGEFSPYPNIILESGCPF